MDNIRVRILLSRLDKLDNVLDRAKSMLEVGAVKDAIELIKQVGREIHIIKQILRHV